MCGIFGSTHDFGAGDWKAIKYLSHRGPDYNDIWRDPETGTLLGHCRLSVLDTSINGAQPMVSKKGNVISFNGEIYNFLSIKKNLKNLGYHFASSSDTEVLLYAIDEWGMEKAISLFAGMFAFAYWDNHEKCIYLVRDRVGIKPLYYALFSDRLVFCSELKPIVNHPLFVKEINLQSLHLYTKYRYIPTPNTIFKNVYKLPPATILKSHISQFPNFETSCYWSYKKVLSPNKQYTCQKTTEKHLENLLLNIVNEHVMADVPVGAFLSGGIDSATIVALMQKRLSTKVKTFTVGFSNSGYDETCRAQQISKYLQTEHTEVFLNPEDAIQTIYNLGKSYDEPFADSSQIPTILISQAARRHVTVALSGDGGDEIFAGYNRYITGNKMWMYLNRFPLGLRCKLATILKNIPGSFWNTLRHGKIAQLKPEEKISKIAHLLASQNNCEVYQKLTTCWINDNITLVPQKELNLDFYFNDFVTNMMYQDFISYLPDDVLTKVDRASMQSSLEVRVPFLDHRVIEETAKIPLTMKIKHGEGKHILRKVLYKYVPQQMFSSTKMGFAIPLHDWLRGHLREWANELLQEKEIGRFFCTKKVMRKWNEHLQGKRNWQDDIWIVLMFQLWQKEYL